MLRKNKKKEKDRKIGLFYTTFLTLFPFKQEEQILIV